jgi:hypothetical protein
MRRQLAEVCNFWKPVVNNHQSGADSQYEQRQLNTRSSVFNGRNFCHRFSLLSGENNNQILTLQKKYPQAVHSMKTEMRKLYLCPHSEKAFFPKINKTLERYIILTNRISCICPSK